ncbi:stage V sporulation protein AD [Bacillus solimangrovi]|uniref:Stage V sporulation protein AD n=1 Tax=Bacillus solimangrovi TaxID=1305675 RepID=A0A1E5LHQ7_9BACI|nr:stage V sporulation protein AD [Bacillus solimangrovi]OEH93586.1 stage V sporulation protein AD [Bacillus solimangrovi]
MKLIGEQTWLFQEPIFVEGKGTAVGPKEARGPLGKLFDITYEKLDCGESSWEMAERRIMNDAINTALDKAGYADSDIDFMLAGDLLNQNVTSNYVAREYRVPFLCMFGACSTSMETLAIASALIDGGFANRTLAAASSHNASAEKQFRYPTEYGCQKPDTSTFTVTGAGAIVIGKKEGSVRITSATIGKVIDYGLNDPFDMGSAMAPAAADTISRHFRDLARTPQDYDLIATGDLSAVGSPILVDLLQKEGFDMTNIHNDCGLMIYYSDQGTFAGGSGCGCSAVVTYGHLLDEVAKGSLKRIFIVATGALLSPTMLNQKETIPCIAHGVVFEHVPTSS